MFTSEPKLGQSIHPIAAVAPDFCVSIQNDPPIPNEAVYCAEKAGALERPRSRRTDLRRSARKSILF